jgi:hypothetical protein
MRWLKRSAVPFASDDLLEAIDHAIVVLRPGDRLSHLELHPSLDLYEDQNSISPPPLSSLPRGSTQTHDIWKKKVSIEMRQRPAAR